MTFERVFQALIVGVAGLGFLALSLTGTVGWLGSLAMLFGLLGPMILGTRQRFSSVGWNILTLIMLAWTAVLFLLLSFNSLDSARDLLIYLQINRLFQRKTNRDVLYICLLAFSQLLLSSLLTISPWFALILMVFLVLTSWLLVVLQLKIGVDTFAAGLVQVEASSPLAEGTFGVAVGPQKLAPQETAAAGRIQQLSETLYQGIARIFTRAWVLSSLALLSLILVMTFALFVLIPRLELGVLRGDAGTPIHVAGFSDQVRLGDVGTILKGTGRVMRVRLEGDLAAISSPLYWRGMSLDHFDGSGWSLSLRHKHSFPRQMMTRWNLSTPQPGMVIQRITLEPIDSGILFALPEVMGIDVGRSNVFENGTGALISDLGLQRFQYTVVSRIPQGKRTALFPKRGNAVRDGRAAAELSEPTKSAYLQLPALSPAILRLTQEWTNPAQTPREKADAIEAALRTRYRYTLELKSTGPAPLEDFLLRTREGHCEYFASALVVLARTADIPARLVNGFLGGELNQVGNYWVIRQKDAHAWAELWFDDEGWVRMDATPAAAAGADPGPLSRWMSYADQYVDWFETRWYFYILEYDLRSQLNMLTELMVRMPRVARSADRERGRYSISFEGLEGYLLGVSWVVAVVVGGVVWRRRSRSQRVILGGHLSPEGRSFLKVRVKIHERLAVLGMVRKAGETSLELAHRSDQALFGSSALQGTEEMPETAELGSGPVVRLERTAYALLYGEAGGTAGELALAEQVYVQVCNIQSEEHR